MWTDTHCHLQIDERDSKEIVERAWDSNVRRLVCVGTDLNYSKGAIAEAEKYENVWATVGLHPHEASHGLEGFEELIDHSKVVAIGECGLDYYYEHSTRSAQQSVFSEQIGWANTYKKALVVHTRDAWDDTISLIKNAVPDRIVMHCFTGGPTEAERCLDFGAFISISGIVTFKNAENIRAAVEVVPLDRLLIETDAPWLAPVPNRGKQNEPAWVTWVGEAIAKIKNCDMGEIEEATTANAQRVFNL
jgi:TatD DNase family protein